MMSELGNSRKRRRVSRCEPVLLAEDDENVILRLHEAFTEAEIKNPLFVVFDGQYVIHYLAGLGRFENRLKYPIPCLVLLGTDLSQRNGLEVLEWIRQDLNPLRMLPVILLAPRVEKSELKKALALGAHDYIPKSFTLSELVDWARGLKSSILQAGSIYGTIFFSLLCWV